MSSNLMITGEQAPVFISLMLQLNTARSVILYFWRDFGPGYQELQSCKTFSQPIALLFIRSFTSRGSGSVNGNPKIPNYGSENSPDLLKTFALCSTKGIYPE